MVWANDASFNFRRKIAEKNKKDTWNAVLPP